MTSIFVNLAILAFFLLGIISVTNSQNSIYQKFDLPVNATELGQVSLIDAKYALLYGNSSLSEKNDIVRR
jgi:hypothetical protein